jgi:hypothetical protein
MVDVQGLNQIVPRYGRCEWLAKRGDFVTARSAGCRFNSHYPQEIHDWMFRDIVNFRQHSGVLVTSYFLAVRDFAALNQDTSSGHPWHCTIHDVANVLNAMEDII